MSMPYGQQQNWHPPTGLGAPSAPGSGMANGAPVVQIGDIVVTTTEVITPSGRIPLRDAQITFMDQSTTRQVTPTWAVVLAVIGFLFFLLGLLFLLVKEEQTTGFVTVTVTGPGFVHTSRMPVSNRTQVNDYAGRTMHANSVAQAQRGR